MTCYHPMAPLTLVGTGKDCGTALTVAPIDTERLLSRFGRQRARQWNAY
jgi:hypothetical protein